MKRSKLFLTGMAALLLSFGLMMTGCDSDGGNTINAGDYISIDVDTAGAAGPPAVAAIYKVTVKKPLEADKKATFTKVATNPVEYIGGTGGTTTKEAQAAAIVAKINDAPGAKYTAAVVVTSGADPFFFLTARTTGVIANAPSVTTPAYAAPVINDVTSETAADVTAGDTALVVTATGGTLKTGLKVFISTDGATVTITSSNTVDGAFTPATGATVAQDGLKIIVKGLAAAANSPNNTASATALKSGSGTVTVTLKGDAQTTQVTSVAAKTGVPVVVPADSGTPYALIASIGAGSQIKFTAASDPNPAKVNWNLAANGGAVGDKNLDPDFDAAFIAVLSNLVPTDTVAFAAGGIANAVVFTLAPTAAAKLQAVLDNVGGTDPTVTLGAATAADADVTVPADVTLTLAVNATLTVGAGKTLTVGAGAIVRLPDTATVVIPATSVISLADATSVINVGSTTATTFQIKGAAGGASTFTAGGSSQTVSLQGLSTGSKILGSGATATLTIGGNDGEIAVAATATTVIISTVTVDVSAKGKITIAQSGVLTLPADSVIKCSSASTAMSTDSLADATLGGSIAVTAAGNDTGEIIGTITGAASSNTITATSALVIDKNSVT